MDRRYFLKAAGLTVASSALPFDEKKSEPWLFPELRRLWENTYSQSPEAYLADLVLDQTPEELIKKDFKNNNTMSVQGWLLSRTEVALLSSKVVRSIYS